jgi:fructuronate reductase
MSNHASQRLSTQTLHLASPATRRPGYDRARVSAGIVHLGIGAFARSHLAAMTDDVLEQQAAAGLPLDWGIVGVSLRRPDQRDALAPQDGLYTMIERGPAAPRARIVGALRHVLVASEDPEAVLALMAAPTTRIVTLTVTEKGYCHDAATGRLRLEHPDIAADLASPMRPTSAIGYLVEALARRRAAGIAPFTAVSCDNLLNNGHVLASLVTELAARRDSALAHWIAAEGRFPSTMVDRIVPAATDADRNDAMQLTGLGDAAAIAHEPFLQWVIEDSFVGGDRPDWTIGGAEFVTDVAPYERMKLRMLNAAHSALAYLGYLGGHETIGETIADPPFAAYCNRLWHSEVIPMLDGIDKPVQEQYAVSLTRRFANPAIRHRTWQIAMDGSLKLPVRILPTLLTRRGAGLPSPCLSLAVAAWMRYVAGADERGNAIDVRDPMADALRCRLSAAGTDAAAHVKALLDMDTIFPRTLAIDGSFRCEVEQAYAELITSGARAAVAAAGTQ